MHLTDSEVDAACHYIRRQFDYYSWWPKEAPGEARQQFDLMNSSAKALSVWCQRWLDERQCKDLEKCVRG